MLPPEKPDNEIARLASLHGLGILDTAPEERFDSITRIAKRLFDVSIALVSLVDDDRQWFKSCQGLGVSETPREISFCGHAILEADVLVVEDTREDERFHDNPLVTAPPGIRFYAGAPLSLSNQARIGTLCIIDDKPRVFAQEDQAMLSDLASMVEREIAAMQLALTDELTKVSNRRGFQGLCSHALKMCRRLEESAVLCYFDLDGFKAINDTYGHAEGDLTLEEFSLVLRETFRESDVPGRIGGDEFAVLAIGTTEEGIDAALQRLGHSLAERTKRASRPYEIQFSAGIVKFDPLRHHEVVDLMDEADKAMYQRKRSKRESSGRSGLA
jgi:diguanylate cyclase (GGDEF)-like protein